MSVDLPAGWLDLGQPITLRFQGEVRVRASDTPPLGGGSHVANTGQIGWLNVQHAFGSEGTLLNGVVEAFFRQTATTPPHIQVGFKYHATDGSITETIVQDFVITPGTPYTIPNSDYSDWVPVSGEAGPYRRGRRYAVDNPFIDPGLAPSKQAPYASRLAYADEFALFADADTVASISFAGGTKTVHVLGDVAPDAVPVKVPAPSANLFWLFSPTRWGGNDGTFNYDTRNVENDMVSFRNVSVQMETGPDGDLPWLPADFSDFDPAGAQPGDTINHLILQCETETDAFRVGVPPSPSEDFYEVGGFPITRYEDHLQVGPIVHFGYEQLYGDLVPGWETLLPADPPPVQDTTWVTATTRRNSLPTSAFRYPFTTALLPSTTFVGPLGKPLEWRAGADHFFGKPAPLYVQLYLGTAAAQPYWVDSILTLPIGYVWHWLESLLTHRVGTNRWFRERSGNPYASPVTLKVALSLSVQRPDGNTPSEWTSDDAGVSIGESDVTDVSIDAGAGLVSISRALATNWRNYLGAASPDYVPGAFDPLYPNGSIDIPFGERIRRHHWKGASQVVYPEDVWWWGTYRYLRLNLTAPVDGNLTFKADCVYLREEGGVKSEEPETFAWGVAVKAGTDDYWIDLLYPAQGGPLYLGRVEKLTLFGLRRPTEGSHAYTLNELALEVKQPDLNTPHRFIIRQEFVTPPYDDPRSEEIDYPGNRLPRPLGVSIEGSLVFGAGMTELRRVDPNDPLNLTVYRSERFGGACEPLTSLPINPADPASSWRLLNVREYWQQLQQDVEGFSVDWDTTEYQREFGDYKDGVLNPSRTMFLPAQCSYIPQPYDLWEREGAYLVYRPQVEPMAGRVILAPGVYTPIRPFRHLYGGLEVLAPGSATVEIADKTAPAVAVATPAVNDNGYAIAWPLVPDKDYQQRE